MEKDIKTGSNQKEAKPNLLIDITKGIKSKYILSEVFGFINNKNNILAKLCKHNKELMRSDAYKENSFYNDIYNKFLKVILIDQNKNVINKIFNNVRSSTISALETELSNIDDSDIYKKFYFDPVRKEINPAFQCLLFFWPMENILFKIVSLQYSDFFNLKLDLGSKGYVSENILIDAITKIVNKTSEDRASQLFDVINNNENYTTKPFRFHAKKANLKFPEEENRDLVFARLCDFQAEQLYKYQNECDNRRHKNKPPCEHPRCQLFYFYELECLYKVVYSNKSYIECLDTSFETLIADLNNFKNQLETQNLNSKQKQKIELKIERLGRIIEIKRYKKALKQIKKNDGYWFLLYKNISMIYRLLHYSIYAENPNKFDSVDFKDFNREAYLSVARDLEELYISTKYVIHPCIHEHFDHILEAGKPAFKKIFNHEGIFDRKLYECVMRYAHFSKYLVAYIYMNSEYDSYFGRCRNKYRFFTGSRFFAPLKNMIKNNPRRLDGIKNLYSLKESNCFMLQNRRLFKEKNPYRDTYGWSNKEVTLASIFSKLLIPPRISDKNHDGCSYFQEVIKPNQKNNEIINEQNLPDLNVDKNQKNIYEEWRNKVERMRELYEKRCEEPKKMGSKSKLHETK